MSKVASSVLNQLLKALGKAGPAVNKGIRGGASKVASGARYAKAHPGKAAWKGTKTAAGAGGTYILGVKPLMDGIGLTGGEEGELDEMGLVDGMDGLFQDEAGYESEQALSKFLDAQPSSQPMRGRREGIVDDQRTLEALTEGYRGKLAKMSEGQRPSLLDFLARNGYMGGGQ